MNTDDVFAADRITELEDGILENVLSRLAISEAVATSFISKRFQYLWTYSSARFLEKIEVDTIPSDYVIGTDAANFEENVRAKNLAIQLASRLSPAAQLLVR